MYVQYFYWHYVQAPKWLMNFFVTVQRMLLRFFSVGTMLRTLFAPWHRDLVAYRAGGLQVILMTFAWNMISRGIGFIIRMVLLGIWVIVEAAFLAAAVGGFIIFLLWPVLILATFATGVALVLHV